MDIAERTLQLKQDFDEVYEAGKKAEWSEFWDTFQNYGKRTNYYFAFSTEVSNTWNDKNFKPKYDMTPTNMNRFMRRNGVTNLEEILEKQGVVLDTSKCTTLQLAFGDSINLTVLPTIDISSATGSYGTDAIFSYAQKLHTIRKLIVAEYITFPNTFNACNSLKNIIIEGVIGRSLSFSYSPLTVESMKSIISCLKDYAGTSNEYTYTITFKASAFETLEAEGATAEYNGVACTWAELIDNKKWNLVKG